MNADLRDRLMLADPAAGRSGYTTAEADRIVDRIVGDRAAYASSDRLRTRPARRTLAVAGALAGTVAAIVLAQQLAPQGASDSARRVLVQAAAQASDPPARADQWWRVTHTSYQPGGTIGRGISYVAVDGNRPSVYVEDAFPSGVTGTGPSRRSVWSMGIAPNALEGAWQVPNAAFLAGLPRDVDALRARLYADTAGRGRSVDGEAVVYVADVLRSGLVPADLRRSLYAVLQTVPGVDVAAPQAVAGSRAGVVIAYTETNVPGRERQELLFDPGTGELLAERTVSGIGSTGWTTIDRAVVDAVPDDVRAAEVVWSCRALAGGVVCSDPPGGRSGPPTDSTAGSTTGSTSATPTASTGP